AARVPGSRSVSSARPPERSPGERQPDETPRRDRRAPPQSERGAGKGVLEEHLTLPGLPVELPRLGVPEELERLEAAVEGALEQRVGEQLARREALRCRVDAALHEVPLAAVLEGVVDGDRPPVDTQERQAERAACCRPRRDVLVEAARLRLRVDRGAAPVLPAGSLEPEQLVEPARRLVDVD